mgnify:CR=1 FL=1
MKSFYLLSLFCFLSFQSFSIDENSFAYTFKSKGAWCDRAFLGIHTSALSGEKAQKLGFQNPHGSYVTKVLENSAAQKAGLKAFDYIVGIDEHVMSADQNLSDLLYKYQPGDEATVHFIRNGKPQSVNVKFGKFGDAQYSMDWTEKAFLGVQPLADEFSGEGIAVKIVEGSTAEEIGLKNGDRILAINGHPTLDWEDVTTAIGNLKAGETVEVSFVRGAQNMTAKGNIKSNASKWEDFGERWEKFSERLEGEIEKEMDKWEEKSEQWEERSEGFGWNDDDEDEEENNYPFLGVHFESVSEAKAKKLGFDNAYGSYITKVLKNTSAEKTGMKPFDYVFGIDEYRTGADQSLSAILKKYQPNDKVTVHLYRQGKKTSLPVVLGSKTDVIFETVNKCDKAFFGIRNDYDESDQGVKVNVVKGSTAQDLGLEDGDIILTINGNPIIDWTDISVSIDNIEKGKTITVEYLRGGKKMTGSKPIKSVRETKGCEETLDNMDFNFGENFNFNFDDRVVNRSPRGSTAEERPDISTLKADVENLSSTEAETFRNKYGVDMPTDNNLSLSSIALSPNPNVGMFKLQFSLPATGETFIRIYNDSGRMIYEYELGNFSGEFSDEIDISQNGTGNYFLIVRQGNKSLTRKIVLQNR